MFTIWERQQSNIKLRTIFLGHTTSALKIQSCGDIKYEVKHLQYQAGIDTGMRENVEYKNSCHIFKALISFGFNTDYGRESSKIFYQLKL